jgi:hypothetical protein
MNRDGGDAAPGLQADSGGRTTKALCSLRQTAQVVGNREGTRGIDVDIRECCHGVRIV